MFSEATREVSVVTSEERDDAATSPGLDLLADEVPVETVRDLLRGVIDPEIGIDIVELGLLRSVRVENGVADVRFTVTTPACPLSEYIENEIRTCLWQLPALKEVQVECEMEPAWSPEDMTDDAKLALGFS